MNPVDPHALYASWQDRLIREKGWPPAQVLPFTLALACIHLSMEQAEVARLEFSLDKHSRREVDRWTVSFDYLPNAQPDRPTRRPSEHWQQSLNKMRAEFASLDAEIFLEIAGQVLFDHIPMAERQNAHFDFPGLALGWQQENLTATQELIHILNKTTLE
jgi:hypothetical protein